jgi:hypothetical protein
MQLAENKPKDSFLIAEKCIFPKSRVPLPRTDFFAARSRLPIRHRKIHREYKYSTMPSLTTTQQGSYANSGEEKVNRSQNTSRETLTRTKQTTSLSLTGTEMRLFPRSLFLLPSRPPTAAHPHRAARHFHSTFLPASEQLSHLRTITCRPKIFSHSSHHRCIPPAFSVRSASLQNRKAGTNSVPATYCQHKNAFQIKMENA